MSDYMYLLESHLSSEQQRLLSAVQEVSAEAGIAVYLTGGAMRDMLGGFPIRDLDFTFEAAPAKILKPLTSRLPEVEAREDALRKFVELRLHCGVTGSLRMARVDTVSKPGGNPKVSPAHLLEDLKRRDFTINSIALSLAKASRGLLRDPANGLSDLHSREIRVTHPQAFFEEPVRLLRAVRLKHRLGFQIEERTQRYFGTAVEAGWIRTVTAEMWHEELRSICDENEPSEILRELDAAQLLPVAADILNLNGVAKFEKLRRLIPGRSSAWPLFLSVISETTKPKDRALFLQAFALEPADLEAGKKLKPRATKLATSLKSPQLRRPSQIYNLLSAAPPLEALAVMYGADARVVQDRMRNYYTKYLVEASEITDAQVEATGAKPGTPQFAKARLALIATRLNTHPQPHANPAPPVSATPAPTVQSRAVR